MTEEQEKQVLKDAYAANFYTDLDGRSWRRGMDGWFLENADGKGGLMLIRHHDMQALILREAKQ